MDLTKLFEMQRTLDRAIMVAHKKKPEEVLDERKIALIVEVSEFANEISTFKYWKKHKEIDRANSLEEFVDGIHFLISLGFQVNLGPIVNNRIVSENENTQLLEVYKTTAALITTFTTATLQEAFEVYLGLGVLVGFSEEEIVQSYISKNEKNFERIKNNY